MALALHSFVPSRLRRHTRDVAAPVETVATSIPAHPSMRQIFSEIYQHNSWGDPESVSGPGSGVQRTAAFRDEIPRLLTAIGARALLDAACGDFNWMKESALDLDWYIGLDVVPELIAANQRRHGSATRSFLAADLTTDPLPRADVVLCRDCLVHLSFADIMAALQNMRRSGSRYLLTTTFIAREENHDIETGAWRPLNLQCSPFNFPPPAALIDEHCTHSGGIYLDKRLALWELQRLPA